MSTTTPAARSRTATPCWKPLPFAEPRDTRKLDDADMAAVERVRIARQD